MNDRDKFRFLFIWCLVLTLWGGYFTWRFLENQRWIHANGEQILKQVQEIKQAIDKRK
jgi:hypothetical protein